MNSKDIIKNLGLEPLTIEGGFFRETYRVPGGTCIYYLLAKGEKSDWHKVAKDEIWLYHTGSPVIQLLLFPDGHWEERLIGPPGCGGEPQSIIPANVWMAAVLADKSPEAWGLLSAVVIPAFEYSDFTPGNAVDLKRQFPDAAKRIAELDLN